MRGRKAQVGAQRIQADGSDARASNPSTGTSRVGSPKGKKSPLVPLAILRRRWRQIMIRPLHEFVTTLRETSSWIATHPAVLRAIIVPVEHWALRYLTMAPGETKASLNAAVFADMLKATLFIILTSSTLAWAY